MCLTGRNGSEENYHKKIFALLQELIEKVEEGFDGVYQEQEELVDALECIEKKLKKVGQALYSLESFFEDLSTSEDEQEGQEACELHKKCSCY